MLKQGLFFVNDNFVTKLAILIDSAKNIARRTDMALLENQHIVLILSLVSLLFMVASVIFYLKYRKVQIENIIARTLDVEKDNNINILNDRVKALNEENSELIAQNIRMQSDIDNQKKYLEEKILFLEQNKDDLALKFKDISNQIIKAQNEQFGIEQKNTFSLLLKPFQEQMADFKQKVEQTHEENIKNSTLFDKQIKDLLDLNQNLSQDAKDLSEALKGNKKIQYISK